MQYIFRKVNSLDLNFFVASIWEVHTLQGKTLQVIYRNRHAYCEGGKKQTESLDVELENKNSS